MNFQKDADPHGVRRLLDILRRQQDGSTSTHNSEPSQTANIDQSRAAYTPNTTHTNHYEGQSAVVPGLADIQQPAHKRRKTYNAQPRFGSGDLYALPLPSEEHVKQNVGESNAYNPYDRYAVASFPAPSSSSSSTAAPNPSKSSTTNPFSSAFQTDTHIPTEPATSTTKKAPTSVATTDLPNLTFAQSLPILASLSQDVSLLKQLRALKSQQDELEKSLYNQYLQLQRSAGTKSQATQTYESVQFRKNVLKEWTALIETQQKALYKLGVPGIKPVTSAGGGGGGSGSGELKDVKKHVKIVNVLMDMLEDDGDG